MLLRFGTQKYHITLEILYYYDNTKQLNLFGIITPLFTLIISAWKPALYFKWQYPYWVFCIHQANGKYVLWHGKEILEQSK